MTQVSLELGLHFPILNYAAGGLTSTTPLLDAAGEKAAFIGRLYIAGRPAGAKTLSTGNIQFMTSGVTFDNVGTSIDIGIQDVDVTAGPIARPDGVFDVKKTLVGNGGGLTNNAWQTVTMDTGSKSMTHGDLISVVFDMTAKAGTDSVVPRASQTMLNPQGANNIPSTNAFVAGAWQTTNALGALRTPNVIIVFDDGTLGWIDGGTGVTTVSVDSFQDSTNPDERGLLFEPAFDCKIDQLWAQISGGSSPAADFDLKLYADPLGTPSALVTAPYFGEILGDGASSILQHTLATEISLSKNTKYMLAIKATGTANINLLTNVLASEAHRALFGGLNMSKATRNNSTGAFTAENPALTRYAMGIRISSVDNGSGVVRAYVIGG